MTAEEFLLQDAASPTPASQQGMTAADFLAAPAGATDNGPSFLQFVTGTKPGDSVGRTVASAVLPGMMNIFNTNAGREATGGVVQSAAARLQGIGQLADEGKFDDMVTAAARAGAAEGGVDLPPEEPTTETTVSRPFDANGNFIPPAAATKLAAAQAAADQPTLARAFTEEMRRVKEGAAVDYGQDPALAKSATSRIARAVGGVGYTLGETIVGGMAGGTVGAMLGTKADSFDDAFHDLRERYTLAGMEPERAEAMARDAATEYSDAAALIEAPKMLAFLGAGKIASGVASRLAATSPGWRSLGAAYAANAATAMLGHKVSEAYRESEIGKRSTPQPLYTLENFVGDIMFAALHARGDVAKYQRKRRQEAMEYYAADRLLAESDASNAIDLRREYWDKQPPEIKAEFPSIEAELYPERAPRRKKHHKTHLWNSPGPLPQGQTGRQMTVDGKTVHVPAREPEVVGPEKPIPPATAGPTVEERRAAAVTAAETAAAAVKEGGAPAVAAELQRQMTETGVAAAEHGPEVDGLRGRVEHFEELADNLDAVSPEVAAAEAGRYGAVLRQGLELAKQVKGTPNEAVVGEMVQRLRKSIDAIDKHAQTKAEATSEPAKSGSTPAAGQSSTVPVPEILDMDTRTLPREEANRVRAEQAEAAHAVINGLEPGRRIVGPDGNSQYVPARYEVVGPDGEVKYVVDIEARRDGRRWASDWLTGGNVDLATELLADTRAGEARGARLRRVPDAEVQRMEAERKAAPPAPERKIAEDAADYIFETAQGSVYHQRGAMTERDKSLHAGHAATDVGLKAPSSRTVFVSPEFAREVGMWQTSSAKNRRVFLRDGKVLLTSHNEAAARQGLDPVVHDSAYSERPEVGRAPLELWGDEAAGYTNSHPGNPVTKITKAPPTPEPAPEPEKQELAPAPAVEPPAAAPDPATIRPNPATPAIETFALLREDGEVPDGANARPATLREPAVSPAGENAPQVETPVVDERYSYKSQAAKEWWDRHAELRAKLIAADAGPATDAAKEDELAHTDTYRHPEFVREPVRKLTPAPPDPVAPPPESAAAPPPKTRAQLLREQAEALRAQDAAERAARQKADEAAAEQRRVEEERVAAEAAERQRVEAERIAKEEPYRDQALQTEGKFGDADADVAEHNRLLRAGKWEEAQKLEADLEKRGSDFLVEKLSETRQVTMRKLGLAVPEAASVPTEREFKLPDGVTAEEYDQLERKLVEVYADQFRHNDPPIPRSVIEEKVSDAMRYAARKWDPARGTFKGVAYAKASGNILNYLKSPKSQVGRAASVEAMAAAGDELGIPATDGTPETPSNSERMAAAHEQASRIFVESLPPKGQAAVKAALTRMASKRNSTEQVGNPKNMFEYGGERGTLAVDLAERDFKKFANEYASDPVSAVSRLQAARVGPADGGVGRTGAAADAAGDREAGAVADTGGGEGGDQGSARASGDARTVRQRDTGGPARAASARDALDARLNSLVRRSALDPEQSYRIRRLPDEELRRELDKAERDHPLPAIPFHGTDLTKHDVDTAETLRGLLGPTAARRSVIVTRAEDLPRDWRDSDHAKRGAAWYDPYTDTFYFNTSKIPTRADAEQIVRHEQLHRYIFGQGRGAFDGVLDQLVRERQPDIQKFYDLYKLDDLVDSGRLTPAEAQRFAAHEWLAKQAESPKKEGIVRRALTAIRAMLRRAGLVTGEITDGEIQRLLRESSDWNMGPGLARLRDGWGNPQPKLSDDPSQPFLFRLEHSLDEFAAGRRPRILQHLQPDKNGTLPLENLLAQIKKGTSRIEAEMTRPAITAIAKGGRVDVGQLRQTLRTLREASARVEEIDATTTQGVPKDGVSRDRQRHAEISHELDTLMPNWLEAYDNDVLDQVARQPDIDPRVRGLVRELGEVDQRLRDERPYRQDRPYRDARAATARYASLVNPKPLAEMPGARDVLVRWMIGIAGVLIPGKWLAYPGGPKHTSGHFQDQDAHNILGFGRMYDETLPNGKKGTFVFEVQSDWAREHAGRVKDKAEDVQRLRTERQQVESGERPGGPVRVRQLTEVLSGKERELRELLTHRAPSDAPLLDIYEPLVLRAAIDGAIRRGHDYLILPDAETAMMTEGHDSRARVHVPTTLDTVMVQRAADSVPRLRGKAVVVEAPNEDGYRNVTIDGRGFMVTLDEDGNVLTSMQTNADGHALGQAIEQMYGKLTISQEAGMRAAYDPAIGRLHGFMRKVAGPGMRVDLGQHMNATERGNAMSLGGGGQRPDRVGSPVFKERDGSPKTSITGIAYPLARLKAELDNGGFLPLAAKRKAVDPNGEVDVDTLRQRTSDRLREFDDTMQLLGITRAPKPRGEGFAAAVGANGAGEIRYMVDPARLMLEAARASETHGQAEAYVDRIMRHEFIHAADIASLQGEWEAAGKPGSFSDYRREHADRVLAGVVSDIEGAPTKAAGKLLADVATQAWNNYFGPEPGERPGAMQRTTFQDFDALRTHLQKNPGDVPGYVGELLRQVKEAKDSRGVTTEMGEWLTRVGRRLQEWLKSWIGRFRQVAENLDHYPSLEREISRLEAISDMFDSEMGSQTSEPSGMRNQAIVGRPENSMPSTSMDVGTPRPSLMNFLRSLEEGTLAAKSKGAPLLGSSRADRSAEEEFIGKSVPGGVQIRPNPMPVQGKAGNAPSAAQAYDRARRAAELAGEGPIKSRVTAAKEAGKVAAGQVGKEFGNWTPETVWEQLKGALSGDRQVTAQLNERVAYELTRRMHDIGMSKDERSAAQLWFEHRNEPGADAILSLLRDQATRRGDADRARQYELARNLRPEVQRLAEDVGELYEGIGDRKLDAGQLKELRANYMARRTAQPIEKALDLVNTLDRQRAGIGIKPGSLKRRVFDTVGDAEAAGYKVNADIAENLGHYLDAHGQFDTGMRFIESMIGQKVADGRPLVAFHNKRPTLTPTGAKDAGIVASVKEKNRSDYVSGKALGVASGKNYYFHPDIAGEMGNLWAPSKLQKMLEPQSTDSSIKMAAKALGRGYIGLNRQFKRSLFWGALFHSTTMTVDAMGFGVGTKEAPLGVLQDMAARNTRDIAGGIKRILSGEHAGFVDVTNPEHVDAMQHGLQLGPTKRAGDVLGEELSRNGDWIATGLEKGLEKVAGPAGAKWGKVIATATHAFTFEIMMPALKLSAYRLEVGRALEANKDRIARGEVTESQIKRAIAAQINAPIGGLDYVQLARSRTTQQAAQLAILAPDFTEGRARSVGQAAKGAIILGRQLVSAMRGQGKVDLGTNPYTPALMSNVAGLALLAAGAAAIGTVFGDGWDPQHPFSVRSGNKLWNVRSMAQDAWRAQDDSGKFMKARLSPVARFFTEWLTGSNYRGEKISTGDAAINLMTSAIPIVVRNTMMAAGLPLTETDRNTTKTPAGAVLEFMGAHQHRSSPINDAFQIANDYKKSVGIKEDTGRYPVSVYQPMRYALEDGDMEAARKHWDRIQAEAKPADRGKMAQRFLQTLQRPLTGTKQMDGEMEMALRKDGRTEDLQKLAKARAQRAEVMQRFGRMLTTRP